MSFSYRSGVAVQFNKLTLPRILYVALQLFILVAQSDVSFTLFRLRLQHLYVASSTFVCVLLNTKT